MANTAVKDMPAALCLFFYLFVFVHQIFSSFCFLLSLFLPFQNLISSVYFCSFVMPQQTGIQRTKQYLGAQILSHDDIF